MGYTDILNHFAQSLLAIALPVLAAYLATTLKAFLVAKINELRVGANEQSRWLIDAAIEQAVRAAEQMGTASDEKLTIAITAAQSYLNEFGVHLDSVTLRHLIEAEVKQV